MKTIYVSRKITGSAFAEILQNETHKNIAWRYSDSRNEETGEPDTIVYLHGSSLEDFPKSISGQGYSLENALEDMLCNCVNIPFSINYERFIVKIRND